MGHFFQIQINDKVIFLQRSAQCVALDHMDWIIYGGMIVVAILWDLEAKMHDLCGWHSKELDAIGLEHVPKFTIRGVASPQVVLPLLSFDKP